MGDIVSALKEVDKCIGYILDTFNRAKQEVELVKKKMQDKGIQVRKVEWGSVPVVAGVDSSCDSLYEDSLGNNVYFMSAVSSIINAEKEVDENTIFKTYDISKLVFELEDISPDISPFSLCLEIKVGYETLPQVRYTIMDGTAITFVSKINQSFNIAKKNLHMDIGREFYVMYDEIVYKFYKLLESPVIFAPKTLKASRKDFLEYIGHSDTPFGDLEVLYHILSEGEYIEVPIRQYNYNLPPTKVVDLNQLFSMVNSGRVVYMRTPFRTVKIEIFAKESTEDVLKSIYPLFLNDGQNYAVYRAEFLARTYLHQAKNMFNIKPFWKIR
jgi:hypothetical protein